VLLRDGTRLTLSRGYREQFERLVGGAESCGSRAEAARAPAGALA